MYPDLLSLIIFGFVTAMTPGPNNITSSYSGFNFGYKKTLPLILAVIFGWTLLLILMNTGLIFIRTINQRESFQESVTWRDGHTDLDEYSFSSPFQINSAQSGGGEFRASEE